MDPKAHRLPRTVRPERYDLHLVADPERPDFDATVRILLDVGEATDHVQLHARELEIEVAKLVTTDGSERLEIAADTDRELVRLKREGGFAKGEVVIEIDYRGKVAMDMAGLYMSRDGDEKCLATQCEATDARRIVPCMDEPWFKAHWAWKITAPAANNVLANGAFVDVVDDPDGMRTWTFEPTPPMSSYLIACAIGPFASTEPAVAPETGTKHQVLALGGKERYGTHARDFSVRLQKWYEDYFQFPYHWGKYDQIAVPSFSFGAMENAGLVVFRSSLLLVDPETAAWRERKSVDLVVAHEFAHMWFGNLVTMDWWDDLWLNEAFAEWIAHKAVDELEPSHEVWLEFSGRTSSALRTDALASTHAIYHPIKTPAEAGEMFDQITYGKGSATMRMIEAFLGEEGFRNGLRTYMREFAEKNTHGPDLWRHLSEASARPVGRIMESWIGQAGHPVVRASLRDDPAGFALDLRQQRARSSPRQPRSDQLWDVPLVVRHKDDAGVHETRVLLTDSELVQPFDAKGEVAWVHLNTDDVGFYRAAPDAELLARLVAHYEELSPAERSSLLRDQWAEVRSGECAPEGFLALVERAVEAEDHYSVAEDLVGLLRELERLLRLLERTEEVGVFRGWVAAHYAPRLAALGVTAGSDDAPWAGQLRATMLRAAAQLGRHPESVQTAQQLAARDRGEPGSVIADLASVSVVVSAQEADDEHMETHLQTYLKRRESDASPQDVERYLYTMAAFQAPAHVERVLAATLDGTVPNQGVGPLLRIMLMDPTTGARTWEHLKANWRELRADVGEAWVAILVEASGSLPPTYADDVARFFAENLDGVAQQSLARAKESLADRAHLLERIGAPLAAWAARLKGA